MTRRSQGGPNDANGDRSDPLDAGDEAAGPPLPLGRRVSLEGRGTTFVREVRGPEGASVVLLLHGWIASGGLNWFQAFDPLGEHFGVLAMDHRGHGRGIRSPRRFRLADCADDAAALLRRLDTGPVIAVGYSMGGPIAQLLWRRHPELVRGMVLCSTSHAFIPGVREKYIFMATMAAAVGTTRLGQVASRLPRRMVSNLMPDGATERPNSMQRWSVAEFRRHDMRHVMEAGLAIGNYDASDWIGDIDVPTAVVVTAEDRALNPERQLETASLIPGASVHRIDGGHAACAFPGFGATIRDACLDVDRRGSRRARLARRLFGERRSHNGPEAATATAAAAG